MKKSTKNKIENPPVSGKTDANSSTPSGDGKDKNAKNEVAAIGKETGFFAAFFRFLRGSKRYVLLTLSALTLAIFCSYIVPQITRVTIDSLIDNEPLGRGPFGAAEVWAVRLLGGVDFLRSHMIVVGAVIVGVVIVQLSFAYVRRMSTHTTSLRVTKKIKDDVFLHIQRLPYAWHMSVKTGDIIQRATQDADLIGRYTAFQLVELFRVIIMIAVSVPLMLMMNITMTLVVTAFLPIIALYSALIFPKMSKKFRKADEEEGSITAKIQENLTGVRVVRAFGQQAEETRKFVEKNEKYVSLWIKLGRMLSLYWASGDFLGGLQLLSVLTAGAVLTVQGDITKGTMVLFLFYSQMLIWPVRNIGRILAETGRVKIALKRLTEVLDATEEDENTAGITPVIRGEIEFKNVTFGYDKERPVLNNLSFVLPAGGSLGILGGTGSGKSTIGLLLSRLYDPWEGEILLDGINIKEYNLPHLRKNVGLILQEPFLFSKSVKENISIAAAGTDSADLIRYAKIANVDNAIEEFKDGYDTVLGEKGVTLSGGQKQRVAIARTLLTRPPVLVFDDSLSAVDTETDYKIRSSLKENLTGTTMILISHRITTLMDADNIMVIDNGKVADFGPHRRLIEKDGAYKRVYLIQSGGLGGPDSVENTAKEGSL